MLSVIFGSPYHTDACSSVSFSSKFAFNQSVDATKTRGETGITADTNSWSVERVYQRGLDTAAAAHHDHYRTAPGSILTSSAQDGGACIRFITSAMRCPSLFAFCGLNRITLVHRVVPETIHLGSSVNVRTNFHGSDRRSSFWMTSNNALLLCKFFLLFLANTDICVIRQYQARWVIG